MTTERACDAQIPFSVRRAIARYTPQLRAQITRRVQARMEELADQNRVITAEDIGECAERILFGADEYDRRMEQLCLEAVDRGDETTLQDVINELESEISGAA